MSFQYTAHLNIGKKHAKICQIADKRAYFMSIQLFTSSVLMWLGKSIVWTLRRNTNRKETTGIWPRLRTEQIAFFSTEDKGSLSGPACHCMRGCSCCGVRYMPCIPGHPCATAHTHTRRTVSALSDRGQVLMAENLQSPKHAAHVDEAVNTKYGNMRKYSSYLFLPQSLNALCEDASSRIAASLASGQQCSLGLSLLCNTFYLLSSHEPSHLLMYRTLQ